MKFFLGGEGGKYKVVKLVTSKDQENTWVLVGPIKETILESIDKRTSMLDHVLLMVWSVKGL